jgi:hypothetical protein
MTDFIQIIRNPPVLSESYAVHGHVERLIFTPANTGERLIYRNTGEHRRTRQPVVSGLKQLIYFYRLILCLDDLLLHASAVAAK